MQNRIGVNLGHLRARNGIELREKDKKIFPFRKIELLNLL
jgi:hypothetical protein